MNVTFFSKHKKGFKIIAAVIAFAMIAGLVLLADALPGNPVSYLIVKNNAKKYVAENYEGYVLEDVSYSFKDGTYYADVAKPNSLDCRFFVKYRFNGHISLDLYDGEVFKGGNVRRRLDMEYRELVKNVVEKRSGLSETVIPFSV